MSAGSRAGGNPLKFNVKPTVGFANFDSVSFLTWYTGRPRLVPGVTNFPHFGPHNVTF